MQDAVIGTVTVDRVAVAGGDARRALDRLFGLYLLAAGAALVFPLRPPLWPVLLVLHLLGAALAFGLPPFPGWVDRLERAAPRFLRLVHDWYPLAFVPLLYEELAVLNIAVHGGHYYDAIIMHVEQALFGMQPSYELSRKLPYLALSEPLHLAYLSYYLIIYGPPLLLYLKGRKDDFRRLLFPLMLVFFVHFLFFIYFPVQGPRYIFPAPGGVLAQGPIYRFAHSVLEAGSSRGAAFPSSHVAVSTAQTLLVFRFLPGLGPVTAILATGLAFGAVYGGFHYATDALAGLIMGILLVSVAPAVQRLLVRPGVER